MKSGYLNHFLFQIVIFLTYTSFRQLVVIDKQSVILRRQRWLYSNDFKENFKFFLCEKYYG